MKSFKLSINGDIVISDGKIEMISGNELKRQTCETVVGTNNGEWFLNLDEGINHRAIVCKSPNQDEVRSEIQKGLLQVDGSLFITEFNYAEEGRKSVIGFTASNGKEIVKGGTELAR